MADQSLQERVAQLFADAAILHNIIHADALVLYRKQRGGLLPSVAKALADLDTRAFSYEGNLGRSDPTSVTSMCCTTPVSTWPLKTFPRTRRSPTRITGGLSVFLLLRLRDRRGSRVFREFKG